MEVENILVSEVLTEETYPDYIDSLNDFLAVGSFNPAIFQEQENKKIIDRAINLGLVDPETFMLNEITEEQYNKIIGTAQAAAAPKAAEPAAAPVKASATTEQAAGSSVRSMFSKTTASQNEEEITPENLLPALSKYMGMEIKDTQTAKTLFESIKKFRTDSQQVADLKTKLSENEQLYSKLPLQLKNVVAEFVNGGDWHGLLSSEAVNLDFMQDADKQNVKALIKFYHKDEAFVNEDFTEEGLKDKRMQTLLSLAKKQFNLDKSNIETERARITREADEKKIRFASSIESSVQNLRSEFPAFGETEVTEINSVLSTPGKLRDLFFNNDGTFKVEAAKRLAFALYGEEAIVNTERQTAANVESEVNKKKVLASKTSPEAAASSPEAIAEFENVKKQLSSFNGSHNPY